MKKSDFESPSWLKALTLTERAVSLRSSTRRAVSPGETDERARRRFERWRSQNPFGTKTLFEQRLALDDLTEDDLFRCLAEPTESLIQEFDAPPEWLKQLKRAFSTNNSTTAPNEESYESEWLQKVGGVRFLGIVEPLIRQGIDRLRDGVQSLKREHPEAPFDARTVEDILVSDLVKTLAPKLMRTIVLELNVSRLRGDLNGETPQSRYQGFFERLREPAIGISLLQEYPVLARQILACIDNWVNFGLEFLTHLCRDWPAITAELVHGEQPGQLTSMSGGAGDTHRQGRSVVIAGFSSGVQVVYKPHSLSVDKHFSELLAWLNDRGSHPPLASPKAIDRGTYGWVEFIPTTQCSSDDEVHRFYQRLGAYLALLYALEATDFHFENLIASGENPVLIDLEALFHPRIEGVDAGQTALGLAAETMGHSVLRIGLLPRKTWGNAEAQGVELSGMGGAPGQITPFKVPVFEDEGTDCMRIVRKQVPIAGKNNRPSLNGADINPQDYTEDIVQGFTSLYGTIVEHRDELLSAGSPLMSFSEDEVRVVLRATRTYGVLLNESYHPDALRDALDRDRLFDKLWVGVASRPFLAKVVKAERADLLRGDIPIFSSRPGSRDLWTSRNDAISEVFDEPSLEVVNNRIRGLNESDLSRQTWFIRASLTTLVMGTAGETWKQYQPTASSGIVTRERILDASRAAGDRLELLALRNNDLVSWIGVTLVNERDWSLLPLGGDLYSGTLGIVLYLAYLGEVTGHERYTELAKVAFANVESGMDAVFAKPKLPGGVGGFSGWGAMVYALAHLHSLWQERRLLDEADRLVEGLAGIIDEDRSFDIIGGTAGCLAALIALYRHAGSENSLQLAVRCGNHLIANAREMTHGIGWLTLTKEADVPLSGFSHGSAGIALMLLELSTVTGMGRFREAAIEAMAYERSVFSPEIGNWPDFRRTGNPDDKEIKSMLAWCHGAPGIALGRLRSLAHIDDPVIREEISIALKITVEQGFGRNHSLCHGDLGNLETVLAASEILEDSEWQERLAQLSAVILDSIDANGWICGVPFGVETPGLMTGLAGIGYGLLRLADPARVPSILCLAPPISSGIRRQNRIRPSCRHAS